MSRKHDDIREEETVQKKSRRMDSVNIRRKSEDLETKPIDHKQKRFNHLFPACLRQKRYLIMKRKFTQFSHKKTPVRKQSSKIVSID